MDVCNTCDPQTKRRHAPGKWRYQTNFNNILTNIVESTILCTHTFRWTFLCKEEEKKNVSDSCIGNAGITDSLLKFDTDEVNFVNITIKLHF